MPILFSTKNSGDILSATDWNTAFNLVESSFLDVGPYVVTGLVPSVGTGLSVNVTAGSALGLANVTVASAFVIGSLTPSTTNHLYLLLNTGAGTSNTTGTAPANSVKLGTALTGASTVTSVDTSITSGRQTKVAANVFLKDTNPQTLSEGVNIAVGTTTGSMLATSSSQKLGFFGATPVVKPSVLTQTYSTADATLSAYTANAQSSAYTGAADGEAKLADLNALRVGYENLRALAEDLAQFTNSAVDKLQALGLLS